MAALELHTAEPGDDPLVDQMFDILQDALRPDATPSPNDFARSILELLPLNEPTSLEVDAFIATSIELAEQIPYDHPAMEKLVAIVKLVHNAPDFIEKSPPSESTYRYQKLKELLREEINTLDAGNTVQYVGFHTFAARISHGMLDTPASDPTFAVWALRDAFEEALPATSIALDSYIMAAAQWILITGDNLYSMVLQSERRLPRRVDERWTPGSRYTGSPSLTFERWRFWRDGFRAVEYGTRAKVDGSNFDMKCISLAAKAAEVATAMDSEQ